MCAAIVGNRQWLVGMCESNEAAKQHDLTCLSGRETFLSQEMASVDVVVILTDQVPHAVRRRVLFTASADNIPVCMRHSTGAPAVLTSLSGVGIDA